MSASLETLATAHPFSRPDRVIAGRINHWYLCRFNDSSMSAPIGPFSGLDHKRNLPTLRAECERLAKPGFRVSVRIVLPE